MRGILVLKNSWVIPIAESIHLAGIALMVGTIVLADLRTMGSRQKNVSGAWTLVGLAMIAVTGPLLFVSDVPRYTSNPAFLIKMMILVLAVAFHFTLHRRQSRWSAALSVILWTCVVLGGRAIADFDV